MPQIVQHLHIPAAADAVKMLRLVLQFLSVAFILLMHQNLAQKCERINTEILEGCGQIGYNFTAKFPGIQGKDYQTFVKPQVSMLNGLLADCSLYSEFIICSRHVPKCTTENVPPVLPCRDVCEHFVADCSSVLEDNDIKGLYAALCDSLPVQDVRDSSCIRPEGFSPGKVSGAKKAAKPQCENVTEPACQTATYSLLPNVTTTRLQASLSQLNLSCSPKVEEFTCYTHSAPCYSSEGQKVLFPCRTLCEEIQTACGPLINCFDFPDGNSTNGLCELDTWYVQEWPRPQEEQDAKLECYCDSCNSSKCKTEGSCFVQLLIEDEKRTIKRECLDPGVKRDALCDSNEAIQDTKCCEENLCNEKLDFSTRPPPTVALETKERISIKTKDTSPARNNTANKNGKDRSDLAEAAINQGIDASVGVKVGIAAGVLLTVAAAGVAAFFVYKRYKKNHTGARLTRDKLSADLREIKGSANEGFVELHGESVSTSAAGVEKGEPDKNESDTVNVEETKKRKAKGTVTFGTVTIGGLEDGEGSSNIVSFFSHDSALY